MPDIAYLRKMIASGKLSPEQRAKAQSIVDQAEPGPMDAGTPTLRPTARPANDDNADITATSAMYPMAKRRPATLKPAPEDLSDITAASLTKPMAEPKPRAERDPNESFVGAPVRPGERPVVASMDPVEAATETLATENDRNPKLRSASKRVSNYAEPFFGGHSTAVGHKPFAFYEPTPDMIMQRLEAYGESLGGQQQAVVDEHIRDIREKGKSSEHYKEIADNYWRAARGKFVKAGQPIQRVEYTGMDSAAADFPGDSTMRQRAGYAANNVNQAVSSAVYGADHALTGGMLSESLPWVSKAQGTSGDEEQQALIHELQAEGYLPTDRESKGQEYDPVLSGLGGVGALVAAGPLRGATLGGQALKAASSATGALYPMFRGTTLAARLGRAAAVGAGGAAGAGVESVGRRVVADMGRRANDEMLEPREDVFGGVATDMANGALLGMGGAVAPKLPGMLGGAASYVASKLPKTPPPGGAGGAVLAGMLGGDIGMALGQPVAGALAGAVLGGSPRMAKPALEVAGKAGAMADTSIQGLRAAIEKALGPNVMVPDSMLGYLGQALGIAQAGD